MFFPLRLLAATAGLVTVLGTPSQDDVVAFLADMLDYQARYIAPARVSAFLCAVSTKTFLRTMSARGVGVQVLPLRTSRGDINETVVLPSLDPAFALSLPIPNSLAVDGILGPLAGRYIAEKAVRDQARAHEDPAADSIVLDLSCPGARNTLSVAEKLRMFRRPFRWLLLDLAKPCSDEEARMLAPGNALIDSQVCVVCVDAEDSFVVREVYRPVLGAPVVTQVTAEWRDAHFASLQVQRPAVVRNMQNNTVHISYVVMQNTSMEHMQDGTEEERDQLSVMCFLPIEHTLKMMNATPSYHWTETWGYGKTVGLMGMQARGEADIGGTPNLMVPVRLAVQTFTGYYTPGKGVFVFRAPPLTYEHNVFALPFPGKLWAVSVAAVVLCCLVVVVALRTESRIHPQEEGGGNKRALTGSWSDVALLAFGAICQQGSPLEARGMSGRLVTFVLFIAVLFLYTSYTASIVVLLQSSSSSIRTLQDLRQSRLKVAIEDLPYNTFYFETADDPLRRSLYLEKIAATDNHPANYLKMEDGVQRMRTGLFAFHTLASELYGKIKATFLEHEKCGLIEIGGFVPTKDPQITVARGSAITETFKVKLLILWERGIRARFVRRYTHTRPQCVSQGGRFVSVGLTDARAAFYLLVGGSSLAVLIILLESLAYRCTCRHSAAAAAARSVAANGRPATVWENEETSPIGVRKRLKRIWPFPVVVRRMSRSLPVMYPSA